MYVLLFLGRTAKYAEVLRATVANSEAPNNVMCGCGVNFAFGAAAKRRQ